MGVHYVRVSEIRCPFLVVRLKGLQYIGVHKGAPIYGNSLGWSNLQRSRGTETRE